MDNSRYNFYYCQKIIIFSEDWSKLFLARRQGEADYDGTFALIGGKMERTDKGIIEGLRREKNEEIGKAARLQVYPDATHNLLYIKKDGNHMVLPHYLARYIGGEIRLNPEEYSEFAWVPIAEVDAFEPKIENIPAVLEWALAFKKAVSQKDFIEI